MGEGKMGMGMSADSTSIGAAVASSFIFNADRSAANYYEGKPDLYDMSRDVSGTRDGASFAIFAPAASRIAAKANNYYSHNFNSLQQD
ncbi:hypothetical protein BH10CYA1_BH10CYA1_07180 [soil metagenome]